MAEKRQYIAIDLKSFYASVEAVERGLDPLAVNLVVADESRTDKTICLAVSPSLKALGIPGRARLFEVKQRMREVNALRRSENRGRAFSGSSPFAAELAADPTLELSCIIAQPRMRHYMDYSRKIVEIYLRYVSADDLLVYSIDEVFIDATHYLKHYGMTAHEFARTMIRDVQRETRITATAGIGTNLYLAKIAMDIMAKHSPADEDGVRIAELDEQSYRAQLWCHRPLTDFWRVGRGISRKLEQYGMYTMGDIARCSVGPEGSYRNEDLLYRLFGVNAELLIDHAWGREPAEIADCKAYIPESRSLSQGQVLTCPYPADKGRLVVQEMADMLSMDLVRKGLYTDRIVLDVGYDVDNLKGDAASRYRGEVVTDRYGRSVPKGVHGSCGLGGPTCSTKKIVDAAAEIYDRITDSSLLVRRFTVAAENLVTQLPEETGETTYEQLRMFVDYEERERERAAEKASLAKERNVQKALLRIRDKYGKNAIVRGMNLKDGATAIERNSQVGGHKA